MEAARRGHRERRGGRGGEAARIRQRRGSREEAGSLAPQTVHFAHHRVDEIIRLLRLCTRLSRQSPLERTVRARPRWRCRTAAPRGKAGSLAPQTVHFAHHRVDEIIRLLLLVLLVRALAHSNRPGGLLDEPARRHQISRSVRTPGTVKDSVARLRRKTAQDQRARGDSTSRPVSQRHTEEGGAEGVVLGEAVRREHGHGTKRHERAGSSAGSNAGQFSHLGAALRGFAADDFDHLEGVQDLRERRWAFGPGAVTIQQSLLCLMATSRLAATSMAACRARSLPFSPSVPLSSSSLSPLVSPPPSLLSSLPPSLPPHLSVLNSPRFNVSFEHLYMSFI